MNELIFRIFSTVAQNAMDRDQSITLSLENSKHDGKTIISESHSNKDILTMSIYPVPKDGDDKENDDEENDDEEEDSYEE